MRHLQRTDTTQVPGVRETIHLRVPWMPAAELYVLPRETGGINSEEGYELELEMGLNGIRGCPEIEV